MDRKMAHKRTWVDDLMDQVNDPRSYLNKAVDYILWLNLAVIAAMIAVVLKGN